MVTSRVIAGLLLLALLATAGAIASGGWTALSAEHLLIAREIQVRQYAALSQREAARAEAEKARAALQTAERDMKDAQRLLDAANQELKDRQAEWRVAYDCSDCELQGEKMLFVRPKPLEVTVTPNP